MSLKPPFDPGDIVERLEGPDTHSLMYKGGIYTIAECYSVSSCEEGIKDWNINGRVKVIEIPDCSFDTQYFIKRNLNLQDNEFVQAMKDKERMLEI